MLHPGRSRRFTQDPPVKPHGTPFPRCLRRDSRYAIAELQKDVETELETLPEAERAAARTQFGVFVVHNKLKDKLGHIPADIP